MSEAHGAVAPALLAWYDREARILPWRALPGVSQDPYKVWLSEIMLQQTTVKAVTPRFATFLHRWPDVTALAGAELGEVLAAWAGLGYYARARNLHACARVVAEEHGGVFPKTEAELRKLPGIGAYTAAAIAAIAFGERATPVDGNIERVVARFFALKTPLPAAKVEIKALAETLTPAKRTGDYAQAMMDLGATICTPRRPACGLCPLRPGCRACAEGLAEVLPYRGEKAERPTRRGAAYVVVARRWRGAVARAARSKACSAACWRRRQRHGARPSRAARIGGGPRAGRGDMDKDRLGWSSTPSPIFIWSFPSIAPRLATTRF